MGTFVDTPGPKPGNDGAVKLQKSIAAGATMPKSARRVSVDLKGSKTGCSKVPGLSYR
jgi:hypothetical protein